MLNQFNSLHAVLEYFISIIMNAHALLEITSHKPGNFYVSSRHLIVLGTAGDLQLEAILILRPEAGEYVFISLIANQVLEDEQRICT